MSKIITLSSLRDETGLTFHQLSPQKKLVLIQNTVWDLQGRPEHVYPLMLADINEKDLDIVHRLLSNPQYMDLFSATHMIPQHRQPYIVLPPNVEYALGYAGKHGLWAKYTGMSFHHFHLMGQLVHSICAVIEGIIPRAERSEWQVMWPGPYAPAYAKGIGSLNPEQALFIGAFSPVSVMSIAALHRHLFPNANLEIMELEGHLAQLTAVNYGIPFVIGDGTKTGRPDASTQLVLTNNLIGNIDNPHSLADWEGNLVDLATEALRILTPGGKLVMIEVPFLHFTGIYRDRIRQYNEYAEKINSLLRQLGFSVVMVEAASVFNTAQATTDFIANGVIAPGSLGLARKIAQRPMLITATK